MLLSSLCLKNRLFSFLVETFSVWKGNVCETVKSKHPLTSWQGAGAVLCHPGLSYCRRHWNMNWPTSKWNQNLHWCSIFVIQVAVTAAQNKYFSAYCKGVYTFCLMRPFPERIPFLPVRCSYANTCTFSLFASVSWNIMFQEQSCIYF